MHGIGVRGSMSAPGLMWIVLGLVFVVVIPYLLIRPRRWFERWVMSRRDFARILTLLMAVRAWYVLRVVLRPETPSVAAPWGGEITFRLGGPVVFLVTVVALLFVAIAAWTTNQKPAE